MMLNYKNSMLQIRLN